MYRNWFLFLLMLFPYLAYPDTLTIQTCIQKALDKSTLSDEQLYYRSMTVLAERNIESTKLPSFNLIGQASYQSHVVEFPDAPILTFPTVPKEQARLYLDINYPLYSGGKQDLQSKVIEKEFEGQALETEVTKHQVKEIVASLYFNAVLSRIKTELLEKTLEDIERQRKLVKSGVENGIMMASAYDQFTLMMINVSQEILEAKYTNEKVYTLLSEWTGIEARNYQLTLPKAENTETTFSNRPEIKVFENKISLFDAQSDLTRAGNRPFVSLFAQGGIGRPNPFNFFETGLSPYYMAGLRFQWKLFDFGNARRSMEINELQKRVILLKRENLEDNLQRKNLETDLDAEKYEALLEGDRTAITLQENIVRRAGTQFENGVLNATEYLNEQSKLTQLRIRYEMHLVLLAKGRYEKQLNSGDI
ncbi:MAG: TolC family protein [Cyclobacteriaceae bacterium]|nr:TolC family protein [Cyclobacteriaceae bacterium]